MWWVLVALGLALTGWGLSSVRQILYPERFTISPPQPLPPYTAQTLQARDGASFDVWRLEAPSPKARLLLFHGYFANRFQVLGIAGGMRKRGYESFLFELRGHGSRPGPCTLGVREAEDAAVVLDWIRTTLQPSVPIALLGLSMGAAVACRVAAQHPDIRAVVADSLYSHFYSIIRYRIRHRYHLPPVPLAWVTWESLSLALRHRAASLDPEALAPRLHQPLLAIQGGADQVVPSGEGEAFYQRWAGPKARWFEPTAVHVELSRRDLHGYCDRVAAFLEQALG